LRQPASWLLEGGRVCLSWLDDFVLLLFFLFFCNYKKETWRRGAGEDEGGRRANSEDAAQRTSPNSYKHNLQ
jgi:hypothetical protein